MLPPGLRGGRERALQAVVGRALWRPRREAQRRRRGSADAALAAQLRAEVEGLRGRLVKLLAEE